MKKQKAMAQLLESSIKLFAATHFIVIAPLRLHSNITATISSNKSDKSEECMI